ncbi:MAG: hypothetical protein JXK05_14645 [Campylobacterales bacterium]|nr:hypothetical protein [Campylobacterales bacterium]
MHALNQLEKQQVGLRLPRYLVEEMDELTREYAINRTDIICEAITSYLAQQRAERFYQDFDASCKAIKSGATSQTLDALIDELEHTRA